MNNYQLKWKKFILINDFQVISPSFNIEYDKWLFNLSIKDKILPILRIYEWNEVALTIGRFQNERKDFNLKMIKKLKIPVIRRPTGGRAIIHHQDEITISAIIPDYVLEPFNFRTTFMFISENLVASFKKLNIDAFINLKPQNYGKSSLCFNSTSQYEIIDRDRNKLAGIAQLFKKESALLQISIPLKKPQEEYLKILKINHSDYPENFLIKKNITKSELRDSIISSFSNNLELLNPFLKK